VRHRWLILVAFLAGCASAPDKLVTPAPVVAAERAFAADGAKRGWAAAFRSYAAPEAIMLNPDPINAHESLAKVQGDGETTLDWRPAYAGISRSGDFGFTTGPFLIRGRESVVGHYFTVWRLQSDGSWKWIFDAGTDVVDTSPVAPNEEIPGLPMATTAAATPQAAVAEIAELEAKHTSSQTLVKLLADDARVHRPSAPRGIGIAAAAALLTADGATSFAPLGREAALSGDMVFSMGEVRDLHEGVERLRYYARIWQRRPDGWRIVFDEIVPRRV
jgi:ketosteroid isomerase-like protein